MQKPNKFELAYFIQTRQEIDTEKRERDHILNISVAVLGVLGFLAFRADDQGRILEERVLLALEVSVLLIITSLFYARWTKLQQIANRWFMLRRMIRWFYGKARDKEFLEGFVVSRLKKTDYQRKDMFLCLALSLPFYCLVVASSLSLPCEWRSTVPIIVVGCHSLGSLWILSRPFS